MINNKCMVRLVYDAYGVIDTMMILNVMLLIMDIC